MILFRILVLFLVASSSSAQLISNPNPPVAAAQGVGGAFTAAAEGADAPHWNPAGLAYSSGSEARFAYQKPWNLPFMSHLGVTAFSSLPGKIGGLAAGFQSLGTREGGYTMASESELFLSHGFLLQQDIHSSLAFGYTAKLIGYSLGESVENTEGISEDLGSAMTFGLDVGVRSNLWDRFAIGGSFRNINHPQLGSEMKRDLPRILSGGISYFPYYGVRTTFDVERILEGEAQFKGGINATLAQPFDLRFGIITNPNCFTGGFGVRWRELVLDYAFIYHPVLEPSHLVGIGFNLNQSISELWAAK